VGGHPPQLALAERELGLDSRCVAVDAPPFGYTVDEVLDRGSRVGRELRRWRLLLRALRNADVVHFNFGSSLLPPLYGRLLEFRDVSLLRRAGKAVFVTFQGDDARPGHQNERRRRRAITVFGRQADGIYALNPDLLAFLPARAEFLPYASVDPRRWAPAGPAETPVPVLVHAPSDRARKGTEHVLEASRLLRDRGVDHVLDLVEGVPRAEAQRRLARADLLVDQLVVGWYGGVAVEAMALGKPVVAYIREEDLGALPDGMAVALPVVRATASDLPDVLADLLTAGRERLPELGRRSREFVERWHDPLAIAARTKRAYEESLAGRRR
jgi:glycosyltransferase involved in cell wall biosynthesis